MTRHISDLAMLYVDNRELPYQVRMDTDEHSPVCTIRFGNSFTLSVVDPLMLETFIQDLQKFADAAHELHYGIQAQRVEALGEEMARLQQKLDDAGAQRMRAAAEEEINAARARYLREEEVEEAPTGFDPTTLPEVMAVLRSEMQELLDHGRDWDQLEEAEPTTLPEAIAVLAEGAGLQRLPQTEPEPCSEPSKVERRHAERMSKVERLMRGTVSAPQIDPMNDPMNW